MPGAKALEVKKQKVKALKEKIESASVIVLADYKGINVKEITEFRKKLYKEDAEYTIIKNTLLERAAEEAGFSQLKEHSKGSTAVLFGYKDPVTPIKTLVEFIEDVEKGQIRAGIMEKVFIDADKAKEISKLPTREELLAKLIGSMQSPIYGFVNVLQGTVRSLVYALKDYANKKGGESK